MNRQVSEGTPQRLSTMRLKKIRYNTHTEFMKLRNTVASSMMNSFYNARYA